MASSLSGGPHLSYDPSNLDVEHQLRNGMKHVYLLQLQFHLTAIAAIN